MMRRLAFVVLLALAATACGRAPGAVEVPAQDVPFDLSRSPAPTERPPQRQRFLLYHVDDARLIALTRVISTDLTLPETAMRALLLGPSARETQRGIRTAIPPATRLLDLTVLEQIVQVDLSGEFQAPGSPDDVLLRIAQVVWTLVGLPGVTAVRFAIDGSPVSVLTDRGQAVERPVTVHDYAAVRPPNAPG